MSPQCSRALLRSQQSWTFTWSPSPTGGTPDRCRECCRQVHGGARDRWLEPLNSVTTDVSESCTRSRWNVGGSPPRMADKPVLTGQVQDALSQLLLLKCGDRVWGAACCGSGKPSGRHRWETWKGSCRTHRGLSHRKVPCVAQCLSGFRSFLRLTPTALQKSASRASLIQAQSANIRLRWAFTLPSFLTRLAFVPFPPPGYSFGNALDAWEALIRPD